MNILAKLSSVKFKEGDKINAYVGQSNQLIVVYYPGNYSPKDGTWDYDDDFIDPGYKDGTSFTFTPLKAGTTTISFTPNFRDDLEITCDVEISNSEVDEIQLSPSLSTVGLGSSFDVNVKYLPDVGTDMPSWSFDETLISYNQAGSTRDKGHFDVVTQSPTAGKVTATYGSATDSAMYFITNNPIQSLQITPTNTSVFVGSEFVLQIAAQPFTADKIGIWEYDEEYFEYLPAKSSWQYSYFRALKSTLNMAAQKITFSCNSNVSATCTVTVNFSDVNSVTIDTTATSVKVPNGFTVNVTYDPPTAKHGGDWVYDNKYFKMEPQTTEDCGYFTAIAPSDDALPISFSSGGKKSNIIYVTPDYSDLKSVTFEPSEINVKALDSFGVNVIYHPDTARHSGSWDIDDYLDYVKKSDGSLGDSYNFSTISSTYDKGFADDSIELSFDSGYSVTKLKCKIDYSDLVSISYTPDTDTIAYGDSTKVNVTYNPESAKHSGEWKISNPYTVEEAPDSTADVGHFIGDVKVDQMALIDFVPDTPMQKPQPKSFRVIVGYSDLDSVGITPTSGTHFVGDKFVINMLYYPDTAQQDGAFQWTFPSGYVEMVLAESSNTKTTFRALKPTPPEGIKLSFIPDGVDPVDYTCVVQYDPISAITLTPSTSSVKPGGTVSINVKYDPPNAQHKGYWEYDMDKVAYLQGSQPTENADFYILKNIDAGDTVISYVYDSFNKASHTCTVEFSDTKSVLTTPSNVNSPRGSDFYVDIVYEPESAQHLGEWTYDQTKIAYLQDSTQDKAHFKVLDNAQTGMTLLKFTSTPINPLQTPPIATVICFIQ